MLCQGDVSDKHVTLHQLEAGNQEYDDNPAFKNTRSACEQRLLIQWSLTLTTCIGGDLEWRHWILKAATRHAYLRTDETPLVVSLACLQANAAPLGAAYRMAYSPVMPLSTHY